MTALPVPGVTYYYNDASRRFEAPGRDPLPAVPGPVTVDYDWSDENPPWAYDDVSEFRTEWPTGVTVVPIQTGSSDFFTNLQNTVNAAGKRVVVELGEGVYRLNQFRMIGSSGDPTYSFGFWFPNLQGLVGQGADKTFVQMDANSMSGAQLAKIGTLDPQLFAPLQMGLCRLDGSAQSPVLLGGLTFRAADQQMMTTKHPNLNVVVPQPAPHNGVVIYPNSSAIVSHVRFQGAARALNSQPPFECGNANTQYGTTLWTRCEFDGRRSPDLDPAQPRRCGVLLINNETSSIMRDCWMHHSNVSRYAANDENRDTQGLYRLERCKVEKLANNRNTDPALNGGNSLGGFTNVSALGWESCNGTIEVIDCILSQDNPYTDGQWPAHLQLTSVGSRNPAGGRLLVKGTDCINTGFPLIDGFVTFRIQPATYWWTDGFNNTITILHPETGQRLAPYTVTGSWPPDANQLANAGITPDTHYLIRRA